MLKDEFSSRALFGFNRTGGRRGERERKRGEGDGPP